MRQVTTVLILACAFFVSPDISAQTSSMNVRGNTIRVADTADAISKTPKPADSWNRDASPDPRSHLTEKQILEARSKYTIKVLSFDASKRYGAEIAFSDFVRLQVTNGSSVVLPFLTVRTNRYSKGLEVGWSRAPAIPVGDLNPGQSKDIDYYPKGHLDVVSVDRISVQIEKRISREDRPFFKELGQVE